LGVEWNSKWSTVQARKRLQQRKDAIAAHTTFERHLNRKSMKNPRDEFPRDEDDKE